MQSCSPRISKPAAARFLLPYALRRAGTMGQPSQPYARAVRRGGERYGDGPIQAGYTAHRRNPAATVEVRLEGNAARSVHHRCQSLGRKRSCGRCTPSPGRRSERSSCSRLECPSLVRTYLVAPRFQVRGALGSPVVWPDEEHERPVVLDEPLGFGRHPGADDYRLGRQADTPRQRCPFPSPLHVFHADAPRDLGD